MMRTIKDLSQAERIAIAKRYRASGRSASEFRLTLCDEGVSVNARRIQEWAQQLPSETIEELRVELLAERAAHQKLQDAVSATEKKLRDIFSAREDEDLGQAAQRFLEENKSARMREEERRRLAESRRSRAEWDLATTQDRVKELEAQLKDASSSQRWLLAYKDKLEAQLKEKVAMRDAAGVTWCARYLGFEDKTEDIYDEDEGDWLRKEVVESAVQQLMYHVEDDDRKATPPLVLRLTGENTRLGEEWHKIAADLGIPEEWKMQPVNLINEVKERVRLERSLLAETRVSNERLARQRDAFRYLAERAGYKFIAEKGGYFVKDTLKLPSMVLTKDGMWSAIPELPARQFSTLEEAAEALVKKLTKG